MCKIIVIDSMCGKGKTQWALQNINEHANSALVYSSPLLTELDRVISNTRANIVQPNYINGRTKFDSFNRLLEAGENVAVTHSTFTKASSETVDFIKQGKYTLYLDETIDVIVPYQDVGDKRLGSGDIKALKDAFIDIDTSGRVIWKGKEYEAEGFQYGEIERLAKMGSLLFLDDTLFVWEFPVSVLKAFDTVYLMTYLFKGSSMQAYFDIHGLKYEIKQVKKAEERYCLEPYNKDDADIKEYASLISLYDHSKAAKKYNSFSLSKKWYKNNIKSSKSQEAKTLSISVINNYVRNICGAKAKQIMWSCPKDFKSKIEVKGCKTTKRITKEERDRLTKEELKKLEQKRSCFVSSNARGTNDYADRDTLVYACNIYPNPYIEKFFAENGAGFDRDSYALSALIQWVWRSGIRKQAPSHINLYIVSGRMDALFRDWLYRDQKGERF